LIECYTNILTDPYIDKNTDIHIYLLYFMLFISFVIFTLLVVSAAHDIRLINEYVCTYAITLVNE